MLMEIYFFEKENSININVSQFVLNMKTEDETKLITVELFGISKEEN